MPLARQGHGRGPSASGGVGGPFPWCHFSTFGVSQRVDLEPIAKRQRFCKRLRPNSRRTVSAYALGGDYPREIANRYGVSEAIPWLPAYYLRCVWDMARNYKTLGNVAIVSRPSRGYIDKAIIMKRYLDDNTTSR